MPSSNNYDDAPQRNLVGRLIEMAIVIGTLGFTVYLLGWALWLW
jgi:hypothetical protein